MKKGTHNSFSSGVHPLLRPLAACQTLTVHEQYNLGVRYFDIRVRLIKGQWMVYHGMASCNIHLYDAINILNSFKEKVYVRISRADDQIRRQYYSDSYFVGCMHKFFYRFKNIELYEVQYRPTRNDVNMWNLKLSELGLLLSKLRTSYGENNIYISSKGSVLGVPMPKMFARKMSRQIEDIKYAFEGNKNAVFWFDFIELFDFKYITGYIT